MDEAEDELSHAADAVPRSDGVAEAEAAPAADGATEDVSQVPEAAPTADAGAEAVASPAPDGDTQDLSVDMAPAQAVMVDLPTKDNSEAATLGTVEAASKDVKACWETL